MLTSRVASNVPMDSVGQAGRSSSGSVSATTSPHATDSQRPPVTASQFWPNRVTSSRNGWAGPGR